MGEWSVAYLIELFVFEVGQMKGFLLSGSKN